MAHERIYLDHVTTSNATLQAIRAGMPFLEEHYGLPTSPHQMGQELIAHIEQAELKVRELFGAKKDEQFFFTSSGAEAVSTTVRSAYLALTLHGGKNHFVARKIDEAPSVSGPFQSGRRGLFSASCPLFKAGLHGS